MLRHLGALGFLLFWLLAASGITLYIRFDTSVAGAYDSIGELEWWFGGVLRSMHRYAADAFVVVVAAHLVRELIAGRFRGLRAFSWISGVPLVWLMYASGIVGTWLVWDARAQFSALATAEWFTSAGLGVEPMARNFLGTEQISDRLFSLFVFLHIGLPLALLAGMWVHVQRLGRPATVAPRALALGAQLHAEAPLALAVAAADRPHAARAVAQRVLDEGRRQLREAAERDAAGAGLLAAEEDFVRRKRRQQPAAQVVHREIGQVDAGDEFGHAAKRRGGRAGAGADAAGGAALGKDLGLAARQAHRLVRTIGDAAAAAVAVLGAHLRRNEPRAAREPGQRREEQRGAERERP